MPKLQLNTQELIHTDVDIVAMVKRGANRIPFRLTKKDDTEMLDLSQISRTLFSKTATVPSIVGVIVSKEADLSAVVEAMKESGLDLDDDFVKADTQAAITFTKVDAEVSSDDLLLLKLDDDVALTITGPADILKRLDTYDWESTSFSEVMQKGTFKPALALSQDMLATTFYNIMEKSENTEELSSMLTKAVDDFKSYIDILITTLPESVFKTEMMMDKKKKKNYKNKDMMKEKYKDKDMMKEKGKKDKGLADTMDEEDMKKEKYKGKNKMTKEDISVDPTHGNGTPRNPGQKTRPVSDIDNDIEEDPANGNGTPKNPPHKFSPGGTMSNDIDGNPSVLSATTSTPPMDGDTSVIDMLFKMQESMTAGLDAIRAHVDESVGSVSKEVSGLSTKMAKTEAALEGTVIGDAQGDRTDTLNKSSNSFGPPLLDTAFMKRDPSQKAA